MRHNNKVNSLGRKPAHRKALMKNMANALITHKRINTTLAKAKELRKYVEPLITKSKQDTQHSRRVVFSYLQDKTSVTELFRTISPKVSNRNGGYTRILKTGFRQGDSAEMCMMELVDFNELYTTNTGAKSAKKTTRRGRSKKKAEDTSAKAEVSTAQPNQAKSEANPSTQAPEASADQSKAAE